MHIDFSHFCSGKTGFGAYVVFLALWIQIKDPYCKGVIFTSSKLVAGLKGLKFEVIAQEADSMIATFSPMKRISYRSLYVFEIQGIGAALQELFVYPPAKSKSSFQPPLLGFPETA